LAKYDPLFAKNALFSPISATVFRRSFSNSALIPEPPKHLPFTSRPNFKCVCPVNQGTTLAWPQMPQNEDWALQAAKKLFWRQFPMAL
jgi:hypothetical protein